MQREIHALLAAFAAEQQREARLIEELLGALEQGALARRRMIESLAIAVSEALVLPAAAAPSHQSMTQDAVGEAVARLRSMHYGMARH